jgi:hypothetical protein
MLRLGDYSRDLRLAKWGPTVILRRNNHQDRMSALGHKRTFRLVQLMSALPSLDAPPPPPMPAPEPNHAPLQVIDGNYERMSGVCPWWDAVKRSSRSI